jgi:hypothetical protein
MLLNVAGKLQFTLRIAYLSPIDDFAAIRMQNLP